MEALGLAGKDESVITVITGEVLRFTVHLSVNHVLILSLMSLKEVEIITAVETIWTTLQRSLRVEYRRWLKNLGSYWGKVCFAWSYTSTFEVDGELWWTDVCLWCFRRYVKAYIDFPKPLIGVINGPAVGVSVTLLGLFDVVYATEKVSCFPTVYQWSTMCLFNYIYISVCICFCV